MNATRPRTRRRARLSHVLALALMAAAAAVYYLMIAVWLPGPDGCGPSGDTRAAIVWTVAPFVLAGVAALAFVVVGAAREWSRSTLGWGAFAIVCGCGILEFLLFWWVVADVHHCFA